MKIVFLRLCFAVFLIGGISQVVFAQEMLKNADQHFKNGENFFKKDEYVKAKTEFSDAKEAYDIAKSMAEDKDTTYTYICGQITKCAEWITKCDNKIAEQDKTVIVPIAKDEPGKTGTVVRSPARNKGNKPTTVKLKFKAGGEKKIVLIDGNFSLPANLLTWLHFELCERGVEIKCDENTGGEIRSTNVRIGDKDVLIEQQCYDYRKIEIKGVEFANVDENSNVISDFGKTIYTNSKYIQPLVHIYVRDTVNNIPLYIVIKDPDGNVLSDGSSDKYSSETFLSANKKGMNDIYLVSLGNINGTIYDKAGDYQYFVYGRKDLSDDCMLLNSTIRVEALKDQPSHIASETEDKHLNVNQHSNEYERKSNPFALCTNKWNTYHWGISAGYVSKKLKYKDLDGNTNHYGLLRDKSMPGMQVGVHYEGFFMPKLCGLGIATGAYYEYYWQKGDTQTGNGGDDYYASYKEHNIYVPLNLLFRFDFSKKVNIALFGGVGGNYGVGNKVEYKNAGNDETFEEKKGLYDYDEYGIRHFFMNIEYGGSVRFGRLSVNARFFSPLTDWSEDKFYSEKPQKDMNLSVSFMF